LNDPAVLKRCLNGCDVFESEGNGRYRVAIQAAVGPIRTRFTGKLQLSEVQPPHSYQMSFEGSGGVAGFGKGRAMVRLEPAPQGTRLSYEAAAEVGGRLAQVGARVIDGVTQKMADAFFSRLVQTLHSTGADKGPEISIVAHAGFAVQEHGLNRSARVAIVAAVVSVLAAAVSVVVTLVGLGATR